MQSIIAAASWPNEARSFIQHSQHQRDAPSLERSVLSGQVLGPIRLAPWYHFFRRGSVTPVSRVLNRRTQPLGATGESIRECMGHSFWSRDPSNDASHTADAFLVTESVQRKLMTG